MNLVQNADMSIMLQLCVALAESTRIPQSLAVWQNWWSQLDTINDSSECIFKQDDQQNIVDNTNRFIVELARQDQTDAALLM